MNICVSPHVPRKPRTSVNVLHNGQSHIFCTRLSSTSRPSYVHLCPMIIAVGAHMIVFFPLKVPPCTFIHCMTRLTLLRCSHTNRWIPGFSAIVSYPPSAVS